MTKVNVRFPDTKVARLQQFAAALSEKEDKSVTVSDVLRRQQEVGEAVMNFELNPTDEAACTTMLHTSATLAAFIVPQYFQSTTAQ